MKRSQLLALLFGALLVAAPLLCKATEEYDDDLDDEEEADEAAAPSADDPDTVVLTEANFEELVLKAPFALVEFYAPWCGHCQTLAPHYAKAATALKDYEPKVVVAKLDATKAQSLGTKYGIQGFPTIKWFIDGEVAGDYDSGRDAESIIAWIKKKTGPVATTVKTVAELTDLEKDAQVVGVGYFKDFESPEYAAFKSAAVKTDGPVFAQTTDKKVAAAVGLKKHGVAVIKKFEGEDREVVQYSGELEGDALKTWLAGERLPLTIEFRQENAQKIFNSGIKTQLIYWSKATDQAPDSASFKALREAAKAFKGKLVFVTSNSDDEASEPITNFFGLSGAKSPTVLGFFQEGNKKFRFQGDKITAAALKEFAQQLLDGDAPGDFKSAPIPKEPKEEGVAVVVRDTFDEIVLDPKKDVFLEAYAPWCGHCKTLAPIWAKLATNLASVDSLVIAKIDATENEHKVLDIKGYPTLLFFPAGENKEAVPFSGSRDYATLLQFIKDNAKVSFEMPAGAEEEEAEAEGEEGAEGEEEEEEAAGKDEL